MTRRDRWIRFDSKKRPIRIDTGRFASSTDSTTWTTFEDAARSGRGVGLGYVLGDGVGCIDLDHCITDGQLDDWARELLTWCPATYVEVSISGTGLHIFGLIPERSGRVVRDGRSIEMYSTGRYIAVTGNRFEGASNEFADLSEVIAFVG